VIVGIEEIGGGMMRGKRFEDGGVPVTVSGESGWFMRVGNVDDECLRLRFLGGGRSEGVVCREEEEEDGGE
jgi:hypothetical protein